MPGDIRHIFSNLIADGTNTEIVRPIDWNSSHVYTLQDAVSLSGNTAGVLANISSGTLYLAGGNNITVSQNANSVTISGGGAGAGSVNFSAGTTSNNLATVVFSNLNGVSFGLNGSTITGSVATSLTNIRISAGTTSNLLSALTFSNLNGVTFGLDGSTLTASVAAGGGDAIRGLAAGGATISTSTVNFSNSNGVSFGFGAGANSTVLTGSVATSLTNVNLSAGTTSQNLSAMVFSNSNGVSFGLNGSTVTGSVATSLTNINVSAGTTSNNFSAVVFSNSNRVSFGLNGSTVTAQHALNVSAGTTSQNISDQIVFSNSNNVSFGLNGSTITATITVPAQTNQTLGLYAVGNTTGQSSSSTFDARTVSFVGQGIASVGFSAGSVNISVPSGGGGLTNIRVSAGTTSNLLSDLTFSNANGVTFGLNASTITASVAAGAAPTLSFWVNGLFGASSTRSELAGTGLSVPWIFPLYGGNAFPGNMTPGTIGFQVTGSVTATASSSSNTISFWLGFYTWNASTLSRIFSASSSFGVAAATSNSGLSHGPRHLTFHSSLFNVQPTFSQTHYWAMYMWRTSNLAPAMTHYAFNLHNGGGTMSGTAFLAATSATTAHFLPFWGKYTATTTALPATIALAAVRMDTGGAHLMPQMYFNNLHASF